MLRAALLWTLAVAGAILAGSGLWVRRTFGPISVDQLATNLRGADTVDGMLIANGVISGIVLPVLIVGALAAGWALVRMALDERGVRWRTRLVRGTAAVLAALLAVTGASTFAAAVGLREYAQSYMREATGAPDLGDFYTPPRVLPEAAGPGMSAAGKRGGETPAPKNLVLIYLESIENTFADDELFGQNLLEPVQRATDGWAEMPGLREYDGGGWTMAGLVATQCGVPLRSAANLADPGALNELTGEISYLPGAECLGDVLARRGYRSVFMGGADANFAGKGAFLGEHGYDEVRDLGEWRQLGETEVRSDWGLSDRRLFELAEQQVAELHDAGQPFNLTLLSLDTHESAWRHGYCERPARTDMAAITLCSMQQVAGFLDYMEQEGMLDDTVVVVMGDHLKQVAGWASFHDELAGVRDRSIFGRVWSPDGAEFARTGFDQFSVYPTLLELTGVPLRDRRAGVGVSALAGAEDVPPGSMLDLDEAEYTAVVRSRSAELYETLWGRTP